MREPYKNRKLEYDRAIDLRKAGYGYRSIAREVAVPWRTVCGWVRHIAVDRQAAHQKAVEIKK